MLDVACAKYGWTLHYVLWEVSYLNLNMMLADAITVDYDSKTDEAAFDESKDANIPTGQDDDQDEIIIRL